MLYFKLNATIQGYNVVYIDIHLPGILGPILSEASWRGTQISCLVLFNPEGRIVHLAISPVLPIYFHLAGALGVK